MLMQRKSNMVYHMTSELFSEIENKFAHERFPALYIIMVTLCNRADHYIFILSFVLSSFFLSSPNVSSHRVDVCHTCTNGVALVRI